MFWYLKIWKRRLATLKATNWLWYKGKKEEPKKWPNEQWRGNLRSSCYFLLCRCVREKEHSRRVCLSVCDDHHIPHKTKQQQAETKRRKKKDGDNNKKKKEERTHPLVNASNLKGKEEAAWQRTTDLQRHKRPATRLPRQLCAARQHLHVLK